MTSISINDLVVDLAPNRSSQQRKKENNFSCIIILFLGICTPKFYNNIELSPNLFRCIHMIILLFHLCKLYKIKINIFVRGHHMTDYIILYDCEIVCPFYKTSIISQQPCFTKGNFTSRKTVSVAVLGNQNDM